MYAACAALKGRMDPILEVAKTVREAYARAVANITRNQMGEDFKDYPPVTFCVQCHEIDLPLTWYQADWWCEECLREDQWTRAEEDRQRIEDAKRGFNEED